MINIDFFKKNKTKLVACGLASIISLGTAGCNKNNDPIPQEEVITKTFNPGEHIISHLYSDAIHAMHVDFQYDCPPGYKIIDIKIASDHGKMNDVLIFYTNEIPVVATSDENNKFTSFGTPVEQEKSLKLEKPSN